MRRIWSPWRSEYVSAEPAADSGCIFCTFPQQDTDEANLILLRGDGVFAMLNRFPYNPGHLMVVPYKHTADLARLTGEVTSELMAVLQTCMRAASLAFEPDGFNAGFNLGSAAGAGIADHVHMHLVPRWIGDTNFMPTLAEVKVIPERLEQSYRALREAIDRLSP